MSIPNIDFSAATAHRGDSARDELVEAIRDACRVHGFFQITNHGVAPELLDAILEKSELLFSLPHGVKQKYSKDLDTYNRGYEHLRAQNFENKGTTLGDLKEGWYFGQHLPADHPMVVANKFNLGPNKYPEEIQGADEFRRVVDEYHGAMLALAETIVRLLCETLGVDDGWVSALMETPIAILRLLFYPPQEEQASEDERGIGAHTDFGVITILLQDMVGGLEVWSRQHARWERVQPEQGALVVNLGNLMMRWTNDRYVSNLHRVINKSGRPRYSIPFFFNGNPDFLVRCFQSCRGDGGLEKYDAVTVGDWIAARYADTYKTGGGKAAGELSIKDAADAA